MWEKNRKFKLNKKLIRNNDNDKSRIKFPCDY